MTILQYRGYCTVINTPTRVCLSVPRASWIHVVRLPTSSEVGPLLARTSAPMWKVPLPFVNDMEDTLEEKGGDRVGSRFLRGPRGGTPRFLNVFLLTSCHYNRSGLIPGPAHCTGTPRVRGSRAAWLGVGLRAD